METDYIFLKHKNTWFRIPDDQEEDFNAILGNCILSGKFEKFIKEFNDYKIDCSPEEFKKKNKIH